MRLEPASTPVACHLRSCARRCRDRCWRKQVLGAWLPINKSHNYTGGGARAHLPRLDDTCTWLQQRAVSLPTFRSWLGPAHPLRACQIPHPYLARISRLMHVTSVLHPPAASALTSHRGPLGLVGCMLRWKETRSEVYLDSTTPCFPSLSTSLARARTLEGTSEPHVSAMPGNEAQRSCIMEHSHCVRTCSIEVKGSLVPKRKERSYDFSWNHQRSFARQHVNQCEAPLHRHAPSPSCLQSSHHARVANSITQIFLSFPSMVIVHVSSREHTHTHTQTHVYQSWDTCMHFTSLHPHTQSSSAQKNTGIAHVARHPVSAHANNAVAPQYRRSEKPSDVKK